MNRNIRILSFVMLLMLLVAACGISGSKQESDSGTKMNPVNTPKQKGGKSMSNSIYPQLTTEVEDRDKLVVMDTSMGKIKIKLFPEYAPKAVENFVKHSEEGYYNGLIFHRVIKDFMIQGGDPNGNGTGGESIYGQPFEDEFSNQLFNLRGALSMANAGPNTNGSQFFIVQSSSFDPSWKRQMEKAGYPKEIIDAYEKNGGTPWLDHRHTVFGQVVEGIDVVDKIAHTSVNPQDKPKEDVVINKITVLK